MAKEVEMKLRVDEDDIDGLSLVVESCFPEAKFNTVALRNQYFDTQQLDLNKSKVALRIRDRKGAIIQTLKTQGVVRDGVHSRGEWEWLLTEPDLDAQRLEECEAWPKNIDVKRLIPVFETNFKRTYAKVSWEGAEIEIALDQGYIEAKGNQERICEIELELMSGSVSNLLTLKEQLSKKIRLQADDVSKAERAYHLFLSQE